MSFRVVVARRFEAPPLPGDPDESDAWSDHMIRHTISDDPVASDGDYFNYWHLPGVELGLPLLAKVYQSGFDGDNVSELRSLDAELDPLEGYWKLLTLPEKILSDLEERMGFLRDAIRVAIEQDAVLFIA